jgi:HlyD family secretion protein
VIVTTHANVLRVPTAALLEGDQVLCVSAGRAVPRRLRIGIRNWDWSEVLSGVEAGDQVIVSLDRPEVRAGARVRVEGVGAAAGGPAPP